MTTTTAWEPLADKAGKMFEATIKSQVSGEHPHWFLAIDIDSGDYEVAEDDMTPGDRLRERHPHARVFLRRVGDEAAYFIGGSDKA